MKRSNTNPILVKNFIEENLKFFFDQIEIRQINSSKIIFFELQTSIQIKTDKDRLSDLYTVRDPLKIDYFFGF